jgi:hypothetical protein
VYSTIKTQIQTYKKKKKIQMHRVAKIKASLKEEEKEVSLFKNFLLFFFFFFQQPMNQSLLWRWGLPPSREAKYPQTAASHFTPNAIMGIKKDKNRMDEVARSGHVRMVFREEEALGLEHSKRAKG